MELKKINGYVDFLKGIAIILVVFGHCIQYGSGLNYLNNELFFDNWLFKFIYSFHMPLFMLVSGYLFYFSMLKYTFEKNIRRRFTLLILPIFSWSLVALVLKLYTIESFDVITLVKFVLSNFINSLWFLWAIFFSSMVVLIGKKYLKDSLVFYLLVFLLTFVTPDMFILKATYKFMYPFFIAGYFFHKKYREKSDLFKNVNPWGKKSLVTVVSILFLGMLLFFNKEHYIYTSGYTIVKNGLSFEQLLIDLYRSIIGLFGSVFVILISFRWYKPNKITNTISYLGKNSLGIYIISGYLSIACSYLFESLSTANYLLISLQSIVTIVISIGVTYILKKQKLLNAILFGGRL